MNLRSFFALLIMPLVAFLFTSCATAPVVYNQEKVEGTWQARIQIKDLKTNKSDVLSLEFLSEKEKAMRLEATGALGARVASLLVKGENISYAVHTQRKYYSGNVSEKSLLPLFKVSLDPRWLYNVFFDEALPGSGWTCMNDTNKLVEKCEQLSTGYMIFWSERKDENKRVLIKGADFEINVLVKSFETKVQNPSKAFSLEAPATYKRYKLL